MRAGAIMAEDPKEAAKEELLLQDENSGRDGRHYNEWHATRPDARQAALAIAHSTENTTMKFSELTGLDLDLLVAKAEAAPYSMKPAYPGVQGTNRLWIQGIDGAPLLYEPSANWSQGGPIIEREKIDIGFIEAGCWYAWVNPNRSEHYDLDHQEGSTPLIAAMRAYIASRFGEEVPSDHVANT